LLGHSRPSAEFHYLSSTTRATLLTSSTNHQVLHLLSRADLALWAEVAKGAPQALLQPSGLKNQAHGWQPPEACKEDPALLYLSSMEGSAATPSWGVLAVGVTSTLSESSATDTNSRSDSCPSDGALVLGVLSSSMRHSLMSADAQPAHLSVGKSRARRAIRCLSFLRKRIALAGHKWHRVHSAPLRQPPAFQNHPHG